MPNGDVRRVELGPRHTATVADLPIGDYQVQVKAAGATVSAETVHLSRDQTANLKAVTRTDILIVGVALAIGLVGAPLLSRTRRKRMRARLARARQSLRRARNTERADASHARQEAG
jgi:beta-lactamase regulating signal transducer with metallopeptidase domain